MKLELDKEFWTNRYLTNETGWDVGEITTPLKEYINQLKDKNISILIPGAGNAYEAEYLFLKGFKSLTVIDLSEEPIKNIIKRLPNFPKENLIVGDFFKHNAKYDLIIEQTFFCAINPALRSDYAKKVNDLLKPKGKLVGLLFDDDNLNADRPPFKGNKKEYLNYFEPYFNIITFERCYNSIKPREGRELFVIFEKK